MRREDHKWTDKQPWEVFDEEIFPYLSFEKLFGDLPSLKQEGNLWQACCPIHGREAPNAFSIDAQSLEWNCHLGCGGGGPVQYLQLVQGLAWMEAAGEVALLAGIDPAVLDPWQGRWTEEDFQRHRDLEQRSSLLGILISHAQSGFLSSAGETIRHFLVRRRGFPEARLEDLGLGLYFSPEDMWHHLKESRRDLGELQERGFFDARWTGRILGAWKDLHGRTVNLWGWQPWKTTVGKPRWEGSILLFDDRDPLGATRMPFLLHRAARLEKRDLVLIEGPVKALLAYCLGLENPFPVAVAGELTMPQITTLQNYLHDEGSLTLCWDYDPETYGTAKEQTVRTLKLLNEVRFPVYVVDPRLLTGNGKVKTKVSIDEFILAQGGGEKGLDGFRKGGCPKLS